MPFPLVLPTTSSFSFSSYFNSDSHPSLLLSASTYRGVLRDELKKHKRLPPSEQSSHLSSILLSINNYLPYLLAVDTGSSSRPVAGEEVDIVLKSTPVLEWRPTLSGDNIPGREASRLKVQSIEYEIYFVLSALAYTYTLLSRASLQPLYSIASAPPSPELRTGYITGASKYLLLAASIHDYLSIRSDQSPLEPPCIDISKSTFRALTSLALAEATLLAVLKDDPYPVVASQDRNKNDQEWMIRAPDIPKVKAHLFARLCLAAAEHAASAKALLGSKGQGKINQELLKYVEDLRKTGRGKACRFFGIDAELGGQTGEAIAWLRAGMYELGYSSKDESKLSLGRLKKEWSEKREDRKVEKGADWGGDAGRAEEGRVIEILDKKWTKMNDTVCSPPSFPLFEYAAEKRDTDEYASYSPTRTTSGYNAIWP